MLTAIFTDPVRVRAIWARAMGMALALILWSQGAPLAGHSDVFSASRSADSGNDVGASTALDPHAAPVPQADQAASQGQAALLPGEKDSWFGTEPLKGDASVLSMFDSVSPHAAVAIPERRLQARHVLLPGVDWIRGHGVRGAFDHPPARAPPLWTL